MMKYRDHEEFFGAVGDYVLRATYYHDCETTFTVEEMYQHFKARHDAERKDGDAVLNDVS